MNRHTSLRILLLELINKNVLHECLAIELNIKNNLCVLVALYRSPSQSDIEFSSFVTNLESTIQAIALKKPFLTMILDDFNPKNKLKFNQDNASYDGSILSDLMAQYGLIQIIPEQTHIFKSSVSCIELAFTSQENLVISSGVYSSLHPNCHHQIIFPISI